MLRMFYPCEYAASVFTIDYDALYRLGYRGVLFDIDNTLVPHGNGSTPAVDALFARIHRAGLKTLLLSNNSEERILRFLAHIDDTPYIALANKPDPAAYRRAVQMLGLRPEQTVVVGDQLFTDIYGANRAGLDSILVQFLHHAGERHFGKRRAVEALLLRCWRHSRRCRRIGAVTLPGEEAPMPQKRRKLFCEMNPLFYAISVQKEILRRHLADRLHPQPFARARQSAPLPNLVYARTIHMIRRAPGVNLEHQQNKAVNIGLAAGKIDGLLIRPGEVFSFWQAVGKVTRRNGYKEGRVIAHDRLTADIGGGLCNLSHTLHQLVLHSPLQVTEFHHHSDALAPDEGPHVPFSAGTSICYNYVDFRFCNTTGQTVQLRVWCEGEEMHAELRSERPFPCRYEIVEEDRHFCREGDGRYYHISRIGRNVYDAHSGALLRKEPLFDNHSRVMYDPALIPPELLRT